MAVSFIPSTFSRVRKRSLPSQCGMVGVIILQRIHRGLSYEVSRLNSVLQYSIWIIEDINVSWYKRHIFKLDWRTIKTLLLLALRHSILFRPLRYQIILCYLT